MTGCEFRLILKPKDGYWTISCPHNVHNHALVDDPMAFPKYRAIVIRNYHEDIIQAFNNNTRPTDIASQLRDRAAPEDARLASIIGKDISNALARHRAKELAGRSPLQFLFDQLDRSDFFYRDMRDSQGRLTGLLLAPLYSPESYRRHSV